MPGSDGSLRSTSTSFLPGLSHKYSLSYIGTSFLAKSELSQPRWLDGPRKHDSSFLIVLFFRRSVAGNTIFRDGVHFENNFIQKHRVFVFELFVRLNTYSPVSFRIRRSFFIFLFFGTSILSQKISTESNDEDTIIVASASYCPSQGIVSSSISFLFFQLLTTFHHGKR